MFQEYFSLISTFLWNFKSSSLVPTVIQTELLLTWICLMTVVNPRFVHVTMDYVFVTSECEITSIKYCYFPTTTTTKRTIFLYVRLISYKKKFMNLKLHIFWLHFRNIIEIFCKKPAFFWKIWILYWFWITHYDVGTSMVHWASRQISHWWRLHRGVTMITSSWWYPIWRIHVSFMYLRKA